ncbi:hypothetical protein CJ030_MR1G023827 [Morella rubra]|uniref:Uncharacterized protein n=1 Tax=Morella rubra TaxID=262757 RepID=A0A6A1WUN0_9ROSI|nr:hypothetical protein CJ030_MR1G023827 [Morella rubra]
MARGKHARHSLADADQPVTVEERRQLILGRSVQMEREAQPLELQGLNFEGRTIHDVIHSRGWDPITVQSGTISLPVVQAFYVGLMEQLTHWVDVAPHNGLQHRLRKRTTESTFERRNSGYDWSVGFPWTYPGCPNFLGNDRQKPRGVINANTFARSRAAIRQGLSPILAALPGLGAKPPAWATSFLNSLA